MLQVTPSAILFLLLSSVQICSCQPDISIIGKGRRIASGHFKQLGIAGIVEDGSAYSFFVLALRDNGLPGGVLNIIPFEGGEGCEAGQASSYLVGQDFGVAGGRMEPRIQLLEAEEEVQNGMIRFTDLGCHQSPLILQEISLPIDSFVTYDPETFEPVGFFNLADSGEFYLLDPWDETSALLAETVTQFEIQQQYTNRSHRFWLIDNDKLVALDHHGGEQIRTGSKVNSFSLSQEPAEVAFVDVSELYVIVDLAEQPSLIESDACEPQYLMPYLPSPLDYPHLLAYLSPCEQRRLVILDRKTGERKTYVEGVGSARQIGDWIFYVTGPPGTKNVGELWAVTPTGSTVLAGYNGDLRHIGKADEWFLLVLDSDGEKGRLGLWREGEEFQEIAHDVVNFFTPFFHRNEIVILAEYNGVTTSLYTFDPGGLGPELVATGVLKDSFKYDFSHEYLAFLGNYNGTVGTLLLMDESFFDAKTIAQNVSIGGFLFARYEEALGYLDNYNPNKDTGRLNIWVMPLGKRIEVFDDVSEFLEVHLPEWGILYSIDREKNPGIWFSPIELY